MVKILVLQIKNSQNLSPFSVFYNITTINLVEKAIFVGIFIV